MPDPPRLISDVVVALAAIKPAGAEAALLESSVPTRTDTDRCVRASQPIPCLHGQRDGRGRRSFLRDNPRLRLREVSKAREVVKIVVSSHGTPPSLPAVNRQDCGLCRNWRATSTTLWGRLVANSGRWRIGTRRTGRLDPLLFSFSGWLSTRGAISFSQPAQWYYNVSNDVGSGAQCARGRWRSYSSVGACFRQLRGSYANPSSTTGRSKRSRDELVPAKRN
jgi:hypothetical protein